MHRLIIIMLGSFIFSGSSLAEPAQVVIPEKVKADILKRHPKAQDFEASHEIHFKRKLLEVTYKEEGADAPIMELFREDGNLFTNELHLDNIGEAAPEVKQALAANFPGYELKSTEMISNPNGIGEEYEVHLLVGGVHWKVSVTQKGEVLGKDKVE